MKQILLFLMMLVSLQMYGGTASVDAQEEKVDIKLEKGDSSNIDTHPRTLIPIVCVYVDGMVQLTFLDNLGDFTLTVTNQSTGEQWSAENIWTLPTSTASGIYWVEIETGDGSTYVGTYDL